MAKNYILVEFINQKGGWSKQPSVYEALKSLVLPLVLVDGWIKGAYDLAPNLDGTITIPFEHGDDPWSDANYVKLAKYENGTQVPFTHDEYIQIRNFGYEYMASSFRSYQEFIRYAGDMANVFED